MGGILRLLFYIENTGTIPNNSRTQKLLFILLVCPAKYGILVIVRNTSLLQAYLNCLVFVVHVAAEDGADYHLDVLDERIVV